MTTIFFRLLQAENKEAVLRSAVDAGSRGEVGADVFHVDPASFGHVPGSPFAYWVSERIRRLFRELPAFESEGRRLRLGDHPSDDFRYLRLWWEIPNSPKSQEWLAYYKGGNNRPYFDETCLVVDWDGSRVTYRGFCGRPGRSNERPSNYQYFLLPGLTCPNRPHLRGYFSHVPPGGIFGHTSPMLHLPAKAHWATCAILNSNAFIGLLHLLMPRGSYGGQTLKYEVGYVRSVPIPAIATMSISKLDQRAKTSYDLSRLPLSSTNTSHFFYLPALLQVPGGTLVDRIAGWQARLEDTERQLADCQRQIDEIAFQLYGIGGEDRLALELLVRGKQSQAENDESRPHDANDTSDFGQPTTDNEQLATDLFSHSIGCVVGRWDIRFATREKLAPELTDPFAPLPVCPPGMLQNEQGQPLTSEEVAGLQSAGQWHYPFDIPWDGILVDDPGHPLDIEARVQRVLDVIWKDRWEAIEREACDILGVATLRDYFRKPGAFFDDHLKRYSKSRRQAPIYWPLSSAGGNYTIWLYYHHFRRDTLFQALNDFAKPKLQHERLKLERLRSDGGSQPVRSQREAIEVQESLVSELDGFAEELARVAPLWNPDLNDGVIINSAPLWRMIGHTAWRKSVKECWDALCAGDYDWSHLAMHLWPERVVPKCAEDASLAIAHGLDEIFWQKDERDRLVKKAPPPGGWRPVIDRLVAERTSPAVKAALQSLLSAPSPSGRARRGRRGNIHA